MNLKKTIVLGVLLIAAVLYMTRVSIPHRAREVAKGSPFTEVTSKVTKLVVQRADSPLPESFELVRVGAATPAPTPSADELADTTVADPRQWSIASLPGARVDGSTLSVVLNTLKEMKLGEEIADSELSSDLSQYGLDKPALTIVVSQKAGEAETTPTDETTTVSFGKKNEYFGSRYVRVSGRPGTYLVPDGSYTSLNKSLADLRSKTPIDFSDSDVREIKLASPAGEVVISQPSAGEWKITSPIERAGSTVAISELLNGVKALRATEFLDGKQNSLAEFNLDSPKARMTITFRQGVEPQTLELKASDSHFAVSGAPSVFKAASNPSESLTKSLSDLREKRLLGIRRTTIARVASTGTGITSTEVVDTERTYTVNGKEADPVFAEQLFTDIANLEGAEFPATVPADAFSENYLTLTITKKEPKGETVQLFIGKEAKLGSETGRFARFGEKGEVAIIKDVEAKRIIPHEEALKPLPTPVSPVGGASTTEKNEPKAL